MAQDTIQKCQEALDASFENAKTQFDKKHPTFNFQPGDTVFVETSQLNLMHKKFADRYKGPYKILELQDNNNVKLLPINNGPPISTHISNCKLGTVRPTRLEANDTSITTASSPPPARQLLDRFRFSIPQSNQDSLLEDEDDDLLPAPPLQPSAPAAPARTPVRPAPAPPSPGFHTPESSPTGARAEPTRPLSPAVSSPDIHTDVPPTPSNLPRASSTSRLTRATANPDDVLEYVYDQLPLERRLAKLFKKKQRPLKN